MDNELNLALKIAAAYIRVSDDRQDEYSPDSQLKKVQEAATKDGYIIPDEYVFYDDGISGKSVKKRGDFNRMIATAKDKDHPFERIYVWKFSRFARNQEEAIVYKSLLAKNNVSVVSVSEALPDGPYGSLIERIIEWMDAYYLTNLSGEVWRGIMEKLERGEPVVPPAFGYYMKDKQYVINEEEAPIVVEVFERFAQGEGMRALAVDLGKRGIRTKFGKNPDNRFIEFMLRNPLYIGKLRISLNGTKAVSRRKYDDESVMVLDGVHKPIISIELWDMVQKRLAHIKEIYGKRAKREQPVMVMLKGLVRCSACGGTLALACKKSGKSQAPTYQCCNYSRARCHTSHSVVISKIENAVIEGLKIAVEKQIFNMSPERKTKTHENRPDFDKLISFEKNKLERAKQAYLAEIDTIEQYKQNKKEIEERIAELKEMQTKETPKQETDLNVFRKKVADVIEFIENPDVSLEAKNEALRTILDKVVYHKPSETVQLFFYD